MWLGRYIPYRRGFNFFLNFSSAYIIINPDHQMSKCACVLYYSWEPSKISLLHFLCTTIFSRERLIYKWSSFQFPELSWNKLQDLLVAVSKETGYFDSLRLKVVDLLVFSCVAPNKNSSGLQSLDANLGVWPALSFRLVHYAEENIMKFDGWILYT